MEAGIGVQKLDKLGSVATQFGEWKPIQVFAKPLGLQTVLLNSDNLFLSGFQFRKA